MCFSQTPQTKYYNNEWLEKEVTAEKGKFSQTIIHNTDSSTTKELRDIKRNKITSSETFKGNEPYGIWRYWYVNTMTELNYSFELKYTDAYCTDTIAGVKDYFMNNDSLKYVAPLIEGYQNLPQFLSSNISYPRAARENGITGKAILSFTINTNGQIENIVVLKGTNIFLDKEAVRALRQLKLKAPATLNGQTKKLCLKLPISFKLG